MIRVLLALIVLLVVTACTGEPPRPRMLPKEVLLIDDSNIQVFAPGRPWSTVTGVGCGVNKPKALANARRIAYFNIRGIEGPRLGEVKYTVLKEVPRENGICVVMAAQRTS